MNIRLVAGMSESNLIPDGRKMLKKCLTPPPIEPNTMFESYLLALSAQARFPIFTMFF